MNTQPISVIEKLGLVLILLIPIRPGSDLYAQNIDSLLRNKRVYQTVHIGDLHAPRIDGALDDPAWDLVKWQGDFIQQFPFGGQAASEETLVKVVYDHSNLYVAMVCRDSEPEKIRNILDRRDSRGGDMAGIALDSYHDRRTASEFSLSAAGQKTDLKHLGDYVFDSNWDAVWDGATSINDTGWIAEMKIPFSQIRYADREEQIWGLHFYRVISRKQEATNWQFIPREAPAMVYLFGELKGIRNIQSSRQVEFLPYVLGSLNPGVRAANRDGSFTGLAGGNAGANAKVGISSDFTLDLSVNPDFGQVEADPSDLNLTTFETFFEEKRSFFLEGNDVFDFELGGDIPYYSRRVGSAPVFPEYYNGFMVTDLPDLTTILGAVKLTGKSSKGLSVGVMNGLTAREHGNLLGPAGPMGEIEVSPPGNYLASRVKKDFNKGNTVLGGVFTMVNRFQEKSPVKDFLPDRAISLGADFLHHWDNRNYFLELKSIASHIKGTPESLLVRQLSLDHRFQRPDAAHLELDSLREQLAGTGSMVRAGKKGGNWTWSLEAEYRSPGLNLNDMGYIAESDYIGELARIDYQKNEPGRYIRNYSLSLYHGLRWSFGGENTYNTAGFSWNVRNNALWSLLGTLQYGFSALDTRELRGGPALLHDGVFMTMISVSSNTSRDLYGGAGYTFRAYGQGGSDQHRIQVNLTWLPVKRFKLQGTGSIEQQNYHQQYVASVNGSPAMVYVVGAIFQHTTSLTFRSELFITPELSIQYYGSPYFSAGDYREYKRVADPDARDIDRRLELLDVARDQLSGQYEFTGPSGTHRFSDPDFSFMQFRSNLVFRWEYKLGSTLYLVWSHDRSDYLSGYNPVSDIMGDLFGVKGNHLFMIKLNFWFSV
jgi:hypothetical protein